ncbi:hypothetical protein RND71_010286 [Anisodus tanguticus]|uniref:Uncharacterized protein n=1 Tax=Anisodus tanguticus TaxID=243964 RepID=A0AAE1VNP0_9SOLA|nr:hypothetical protein RND71_010286 [Anisodus tanguticus]
MQVQVYTNEESNKRKNLLEKYIRLCNDAKEGASLYQSETTLPNFQNFVTLTVLDFTLADRSSRYTRRAKKGRDIGEYVKNNAPEFCEVKVVGQVLEPIQSFTRGQPEIARNSERNFLECICFSGKFY